MRVVIAAMLMVGPACNPACDDTCHDQVNLSARLVAQVDTLEGSVITVCLADACASGTFTQVASSPTTPALDSERFSGYGSLTIGSDAVTVVALVDPAVATDGDFYTVELDDANGARLFSGDATATYLHQDTCGTLCSTFATQVFP